MQRSSYLTVAAVAAVLAAALIAASFVSGRSAQPSPDTIFGDDTAAMLAGIPQSGLALGAPSAPVTLVEFADIQCPYCAEWSRRALGQIVADYVRPGKVRIVFRGLAFIGPDSERALRFTLAAGQQGKLWNVLHLLYAQQGAENAGWVTDELLAGIGAAIPSFRLDPALAAESSTKVEAEMVAAGHVASRLGIRSTPSFAVGLTGGALKRVHVRTLDADGLRPALDELLGK
jgi:protein-disulfide isomerase